MLVQFTYTFAQSQLVHHPKPTHDYPSEMKSCACISICACSYESRTAKRKWSDLEGEEEEEEEEEEMPPKKKKEGEKEEKEEEKKEEPWEDHGGDDSEGVERWPSPPDSPIF